MHDEAPCAMLLLPALMLMLLPCHFHIEICRFKMLRAMMRARRYADGAATPLRAPLRAMLLLMMLYATFLPAAR